MTDSSRYEYDWRRRLSHVNMTDFDLTKYDWRWRLGGGGSGDYVYGWIWTLRFVGGDEITMQTWRLTELLQMFQVKSLVACTKAWWSSPLPCWWVLVAALVRWSAAWLSTHQCSAEVHGTSPAWNPRHDSPAGSSLESLGATHSSQWTWDSLPAVSPVWCSNYSHYVDAAMLQGKVCLICEGK